MICEVKRINISDDEVRARREHVARSYESQLPDSFFRKVRSVITNASDQLKAYDAAGTGRHLVYINLQFDDGVGYFKDEYFRQIDEYIKACPVPGVEIYRDVW